MSALLIDNITVRDIRFPTSQGMHGSDAMNPDPDYSCAYVTLGAAGIEHVGNGLTFTIGRGNDLCVEAIKSLSSLLSGITVEDCENDLGLVSRVILSDSQFRWLGPNKGVVHLAAAALINAVWDLLAKKAKKPLWRYVADMDPDQLISAIDFQHISDFLPEAEALERLKARRPGIEKRIENLLQNGYPAYTTSAGWLGYSDDEIKRRLTDGFADGWRHFKIKVGRDLDEDIRRCALLRETLGQDVKLSIDANQVWEVSEAIEAIEAMSKFGIHWVEEPTNPDDILGHAAIAEAVAPVKLATGEHAANKVLFKQFLQANAIGFCQIDACRLAGVNEVIAVQMMADKAGIPVCPHAGGVGLCEYVQHLSMIDYLCISGSMENRVIEHAGQLHGHFENPIQVINGHYMAPKAPGYSVDMLQSSIEDHEYPNGRVWKKLIAA